MKVFRSNRKDKIEFVREIYTSMGSPALNTKNQHDLVLKVTNFYNNRKEDISGRAISRSIPKSYKAKVDSYEKALAAVNLFLFSEKINTNIGYLYIIGSESYPSYFKVGHSRDAEGRLNSYQTATPFRDFYIEKYIVCIDSASAEKLALEFFENKVVNGEWIKISKDTLDSKFKEMANFLCINGYYNRFCRSLEPKKMFLDMW